MYRVLCNGCISLETGSLDELAQRLADLSNAAGPVTVERRIKDGSWHEMVRNDVEDLLATVGL